MGYRNSIGDAYAEQTISLSREIFFSDNMMSDLNREKLMVASYLGGCAIATSYVGLVHPFSAGLSVALGTHHCLAIVFQCVQWKNFIQNIIVNFSKWLKTKYKYTKKYL